MKTSLHTVFEKALQQDRIGSAYLLTGSHMAPLIKQATLLAKRLNCMGDTDALCTSCKKIDRRVHPDIKWIESNDENIKIEMVRTLQTGLYLKPYEGKYKVVVIVGAHDMQVAAANSMLKILEEPPKQTVFLLLTPFNERLLPTIISRCQTVRFSGALETLPEVEILHQLLGLPSTKEELFKLATTLKEEEALFKDSLDIWLAWYRTLLLYKNGLSTFDHHFKDKEVLAKNMSAQYSHQAIHDRIEAVLETKQKLQFQLNRELLAENLLLRLTA